MQLALNLGIGMGALAIGVAALAVILRDKRLIASAYLLAIISMFFMVPVALV